jgi:hypothetical protein
LILNTLNKNESILIIFKNTKKPITINYLKVAIHNPATEGLVQQPLTSNMKFILALRFIFPKIIMLGQSKRLHSLELTHKLTLIMKNKVKILKTNN